MSEPWRAGMLGASVLAWSGACIYTSLVNSPHSPQPRGNGWPRSVRQHPVQPIRGPRGPPKGVQGSEKFSELPRGSENFSERPENVAQRCQNLGELPKTSKHLSEAWPRLEAPLAPRTAISPCTTSINPPSHPTRGWRPNPPEPPRSRTSGCSASSRGRGRAAAESRARPQRCFSFRLRLVFRSALPVLPRRSAQTKNKTKPEILQNSV